MSALITQLVAEEPTVVMIGAGQTFENELVLELERSGTQVTRLELDALFNLSAALKQKLQQAYKIVCCIKPTQLSEAQLLVLEKALEAVQLRTVLVLTVDTAIELSVQEPEVITQWRLQSDAQTIITRQLSKHLDRVRMIFCQDLWQTTQDKLEFTPAWASLMADPVELVDPQITLFPLEAQQLIPELVRELLLPLPQPSILLRGSTLTTAELLQRILHELQQISFRTMTTRLYPGTPRPILPFTVSERVLPATTQRLPVIARELAALIPSLPQPTVRSQQFPLSQGPAVAVMQAERAARQALVANELTYTPPSTTVDTDTMSPSLMPVSLPSQILSEKVERQPATETKKTATISHKHVVRSKAKNQIDVSNELQRIFTPERVTETVERVVTIAKTEQTTKVKGKRKKILFTGGILAICTGMVIFALAGIYATSVTALKRSIADTLQQPGLLELPTATQEDATKKESQQEQLADAVNLPSPLLTRFVSAQTQAYGGLFESQLTAHAQQYVEIATLLPQAAQELMTTQAATKDLYAFVMGNELGEVDSLSKQLTTAAQNSYELLSKLQATLKTVDFVTPSASELNTTAPVGETNTQPFEQSLAELRKTLVIQQQLHSVLPQILGEPTKRTYAIVFQNNQELRPTGGFIQAVALVTFANGTLVSSEVMSSYELDQKLLGSVQPPEEIQRYLGEKQWFLRDSNWDPHFPNTASKIAWFIDQTHEVQVDGVVAVNLESLQEFIAAMGPIDVPEYNEIITDKNLHERMEFHSEVVLAPGSTQRDYSAVLLEKVLAKASALPDSAVLPLLKAVQRSIERQETLIALFPEAEQEILATAGWAGSIVRPDCPAQLAGVNCRVDYLFPVEANVGVNKANAYIARSVDHDITLSATAAAHVHTLRLENTARSNSWPKGTYRNYLRMLVPENTELSGITINTRPIASDQINQYVEQGLRVIGFEVAVPIQEQVEIQVSYVVPQELDTAFSYAFFLQKQSGVTAVATTVSMQSPEGMQPIRIAPSAAVEADVVEFTLKQSEHAFVGVQYQ